jgi:hypothetical protein
MGGGGELSRRGRIAQQHIKIHP